MARFFFHFRHNAILTRDEEGTEFDSVEAAFLSAFRAAQEMWRDLLVERQDPRRCSFEVKDSENQLMFILPFTEVLEACISSGPNVAASEIYRTALGQLRHTLVLRREVAEELRTARSNLAESLSLLAELKKLG